MTVFAATMLIVIGVLHALQGLVAVFNDTFYVVGAEWVFEFDVTTWGWIHILIGLLIAVAASSCSAARCGHGSSGCSWPA